MVLAQQLSKPISSAEDLLARLNNCCNRCYTTTEDGGDISMLEGPGCSTPGHRRELQSLQSNALSQKMAS